MKAVNESEMDDDCLGFVSQEDALELRDYLNAEIKELVPDIDIMTRDRLRAVGYQAYIDHRANGYCESTSRMWARNYMALSERKP